MFTTGHLILCSYHQLGSSFLFNLNNMDLLCRSQCGILSLGFSCHTSFILCSSSELLPLRFLPYDHPGLSLVCRLWFVRMWFEGKVIRCKDRLSQNCLNVGDISILFCAEISWRTQIHAEGRTSIIGMNSCQLTVTVTLQPCKHLAFF